jgi:hypothetical protein
MRAFSAWVPIVAETNSRFTQCDWSPTRQISQGVVGDAEGPDDEVPGLQGLHVVADLLDDANLLVAHRLVVDVLGAAIGPEV